MKVIAFCTALILILGGAPLLYAQEDNNQQAEDYQQESGPEDDYYQEYEPENVNKKLQSEGQTSGEKVFFALSYGATASWLTRIIEQSKNDRSNFVFRNFMPGMYLNVEMFNIRGALDLPADIIPVMRLAAYYPLDFFADTATFNMMPQRSGGPLHFGIDGLVGLKFELFDFDYIRLDLSPALHILFLTSDRWNYFNLGGALVLGIEAPLSYGWTLFLDGAASLDNGNLGGNRTIEPFDITYQFQADFGFRYSKKKHNESYLFGKKKTKEAKEPDKYDEYDDIYLRR